MKFRVAFQAHSDLFVEGSRHIMSLKGLAKFSSFGGMLAVELLYEKEGTIKFFPKEFLVNGWNDVVLFGDGTYIKLLLNGTAFTLLDTTKTFDVLDYEYDGTITIKDEYLISGFTSNTSNFIYAKEFPDIQKAKKWRIGARLDFKGFSSSYAPIFGASAPFDQRYRYPNLLVDGAQGALYSLISSDGTSWGDFQGGYYPGLTYTPGVMTDVVLEYDNGIYKVGMKPISEENYTYGSAKEAPPAYYTTEGQFQFGCVWGDRCAGDTTFDVRGCFIEADGVRYSNRKVPYFSYPKLKVGQLDLYANSWEVLKNIEALKLEN